MSISTPHWASHSQIEQPSRPRQSLPIGLEGASHLLFAACYRAKEENKTELGVILEEASEVNANNNYICFLSENSNSDKDGSFNKDKDNNYWKDVADVSQKHI